MKIYMKLTNKLFVSNHSKSAHRDRIEIHKFSPLFDLIGNALNTLNDRE